MAREEKHAKETAETGRRIQAEVDLADKRAKSESKSTKAPMQAGERKYPSKFPAQHQRKSGSEEVLEPRPMFEAPGYEGSAKLKDMVALITGGDSGIGRAVAVLFAREGADVAICYLEERDDAFVTKAAVEKEGRRCILIRGDVQIRNSAHRRSRKPSRNSASSTSLSTTPPSSSTRPTFSS